MRQIFNLALDGLSTSQIRDRLFTTKTLTPREYAYIQRGKEVAPGYMWPTRSIYRILTNEQYTGSYVSGKCELKQIASTARIEHDREKWIIIPDSHPSIVSKEDFAATQEMLKSPKETAPVKPIPSNLSSASRSRIANGERKSSAVPYKYIRADGGKWEIDAAAAEVVREIYEMASQGVSNKEIWGKLYEAGYPTPAEYFKLSRGKNIQPANRWPSLRVGEILKDEQYIGNYVAGKSFQDSDGKKYRPPKSEWITIPDKHPLIISKELFEIVQEIRSNSRCRMRKRDYLLRGKVACGCCGFALAYSDSTSPPTYRCMHTHADSMADCHKMKVNADELEDAIMTIIKKQAEVVLESGNLSGLCKMDNLELMVAECEIQIRQWATQRQMYYEQFVQGEIDRDANMKFKSECTMQIDRLNNQLAAIKQSERDKQTDKKMAALATEALSKTAVPQDILNALVDKIHVFPGDRIDILWKFANFMARV